jgi:uncharacterized protein (DUF1800 family)
MSATATATVPNHHTRRELLTGFTPAGRPEIFSAGSSVALSTSPSVALRRAGHRRRAVKALPAPPPLGVLDLHRMGFGFHSASFAAWNALGVDDDARHQAYVEAQLDPTSIDDSAVEARLAAFPTLSKSLAQLWNDHFLDDMNNWEIHIQPLVETTHATFIRAIHSERQLFEVLAGFWHDHFNVDAWHWQVSPIWVHFDRDVIRANTLGNFRQMLEDVASSTAMLFYLDNASSSNAGPNENFARELLELHTLGAENYLGVQLQSSVPTDEDGRVVGYVDGDVYEATRCFTGWTVSEAGTFFYSSESHDRFQKNVLGNFVPPDQADLKDGRDVLDALAFHPGTARHISRKLCRRLIADDPPQSIVDAAAAVFEAQQAAPDQLQQVVRTILLSDEYKGTWAEKTKRPFEAVTAAFRSVSADLPFTPGDDTSQNFLWLYGRTGQSLFSHPTPDGYGDTHEVWTSTSSRAMTWRIVNWLVDLRDPSDAHYLDVLAETPPEVRSANALADYWIQRILGRPMDAAARIEVVELMAQGANPDFDLPVASDENTRERLQAMVGLIFMSPAFYWK